MTKEISNILRQRLEGLGFLTNGGILAGIAQPVIDTKFADTETVAIKKKFPVSYDVAGAPIKQLGAERQLVPDANKTAILYFEDYGSTSDTSTKVRASAIAFISNVRVICWLNKKKLEDYKYKELTASAAMAIINALKIGQGLNGAGFTRLMVTPVRMLPQNADIFARYNYDEAELQYLRPPYEYFAIELKVTYQVQQSCLPLTNL